MVFFYGCFALSLDKIGCVRQKSSSKLDFILRTILSNRWRGLIPSTFTSWMLPTDRAEGWLLRGVMPSACLLLAIVKPQRGEKGNIRFTAKVTGLPEQSLTLKVIR